MKNAVIAALVVALAVAIAVGVIARATRTMNVEVRVSQDADEPGAPSPTPRPDDGSAPPSPSCAEEALAAACVVLLAARDALAGDGALNWSTAVPVTEWDGVTVFGTPPRVTGLDLRNRGLTGTIPPELGSLPPTLAAVWLAGNAFTGCVPERLRLAENDLDALMAERTLGHCPVPALPWDGEPLRPGTYHLHGVLIVDIPASDLTVGVCGLVHVDFATPPQDRSSDAVCFGDLDERWEMWLDLYYAVEWSRYPTDPEAADQALPAEWDAVFDRIAATARHMPPPSCAEESLAADCAILLAARDVLAGDGALNWSADVPVEEWDGVTVSQWSRRVTWLSLGDRGLTGRIPPEMGNLTALEALFLSGNSLTGGVPPELEKLLPRLSFLRLSGNSFTGCVPERLRRVSSRDLEKLQGEIGFVWCPVAEAPHSVALAAGTYLLEEGIIIDIPADGPRVQRTWTEQTDDISGGGGWAVCLSDLADLVKLCLGLGGKEVSRGPSDGYAAIAGSDADGPPAGIDAVFDKIAGTARPAPPEPPSCAQPSLEMDCAVLLAARDILAGDGALNWSADVPVTEWDGVAMSGAPWRVTGLDLRNRGLTGSIPLELGNLPPTLSTVYLTGNAFTGCVPERLRLAGMASDLWRLMEHGLPWCPVAAMPSGGVPLAPGTYQVEGTLIVDIPATGPRLKFESTIYGDSDSDTESGIAHCFTDVAKQAGLCLDAHLLTPSRFRPDGAVAGTEDTSALDAVFDQIVATARPAPPAPP